HSHDRPCPSCCHGAACGNGFCWVSTSAGLLDTLLLRHHLTGVDPDLHADRAGDGPGHSAVVADLGAQRVQGHLAALDVFGTAHFRAIETSGDHQLDALGTGLHAALHGLAQHAAEVDSLLDLRDDVAGDDAGAEVRLGLLVEVEVDVLRRLQLLAQAVD